MKDARSAGGTRIGAIFCRFISSWCLLGVGRALLLHVFFICRRFCGAHRSLSHRRLSVPGISPLICPYNVQVSDCDFPRKRLQLRKKLILWRIFSAVRALHPVIPRVNPYQLALRAYRTLQILLVETELLLGSDHVVATAGDIC